MTKLEADRAALRAAQRTGFTYGVMYKTGTYAYVRVKQASNFPGMRNGWELLYTVKPGDQPT